MKIGILTFHCAENYGAVLQCYATQEFLRSEGHDAKVIDYRPNYLLEPYQLFYLRRLLCRNPIHIVANLIKELIHLPKRCYRRRAYRRFSKQYLKLTETVDSNSIPSSFDGYVVGSDQIWNAAITQGFDNVFFCKFPFSKEKKKYIAYAASMGKVELSDDNVKEIVREALDSFDAISVRERDLQKQLQDLFPHVEQVLDPTLMANPKVWDHFTSQPLVPEKYVVVYEVRTNKNTLRIAKNLAAQIGGKVIVIDSWTSLHRNEYYKAVSPENFVNLIRHAACVVTTSYHGTAFSIILNRPFYTIRLNDGADSRSQSLLETLHLTERMIELHESPTFTPINYQEANNLLAVLRHKSQEFLIDALARHI